MRATRLSDALRSDLGKLANLGVSKSVSPVVELKEGERRHVTILFLDIQGFTAMSEKLDPEDVQLIIDQTFKILSQEIEKYSGYIEKYEGDRLMALFGSRRASEQDCEQALRAALGMREKFSEINQILRERDIEVGVRIGVNAGLVVTGRIGKGRDQDFTVMGDAVNLASRLESHAPLNQILVSEEVVRITGQVFLYESLGPISVKGKSDPIPVFRLLALNPKRPQRWERSPLAKQASFVGHTTELRLFSQALERAKQLKSFSAICISSPPGLGKSRLIHAVVEHHADMARAVVSHGAVASLENVPFQFLREFSRGLLTRLSDAPIVDQADALPKGAPLWGYLAGYRELAPEYLSLDQDALQVEIHLAFRDLLTAVSIHCRENLGQGLICILDDAQWIDRGSLEVLRFALAQPEVIHNPVLIVAYRPEFDIRRLLVSQDALREIVLAPLSREDMLQLVQQRLEGLVLSPRDEEILFRQAGGNPFFLEELIQALIEQGVLFKIDGGWRLSHSLHELALPESLSRVIMSRVDRLEPHPKQVLMAAAVIGEKFPDRIIEQVTGRMGLAQGEVQELLQHMADMGLIQKLDNPGTFGSQWQFRHSMTQNVVYAMILHHNRRILHGLVLEAFKEVLGDKAKEHSVFLFHHAIRSGNLPLATDFGMRAIADMLAQNLAQDGLSLISEFRKYGLSEGEGRLPTDVEVGLLEAQARFANFLGERDIERTAIADLQAYKTADASPDVRARVGLLQCNYDLAVSNYRDVLDLAEQEVSNLKALSGTHAFPISRYLMDYYRYAGMAAYAMSEYAQALDFYHEGHGFAQELKEPHAQSLFLNAIGLAHFSSGRLPEAMKYYSQALEMAQKAQNQRSQANVLGNLGLVNWGMGDYSLAIERLRHSHDLFTAIQYTKGRAATLGNLGVIYHKLGQFALAISHYFKAMELRRQIGDRAGECFDQVNLGVAYAHMGMYTEAEDYLQRSRQLAASLASHYVLAESLNHLAVVYRQRCKDDPSYFQRGIDAAQEALRLAEEHNLAPAMAKAKTGLARLYIAAGNVSQALRYSQEALDLVTAHESALEGVEEDVLVNHFFILSEQGRQEEAREYLSKMVELVVERSAKIREPEYRRSFLCEVRQNRYVLAEWKKLNPQWNPPNSENTSSLI